VNKELKNGIIFAIMSASFGVGGFYGTQYYQSETKKQSIALSLQKNCMKKTMKQQKN